MCVCVRACVCVRMCVSACIVGNLNKECIELFDRITFIVT